MKLLARRPAAVNLDSSGTDPFTNRTVPGYVNILGEAETNATVTVNNQATTRKGKYYRGELNFNNNSASLYPSVTNLAVVNNGTNADIMTNVTGNVFLAKTPETFSYDADGNMTNDGRWAFTWDAENRLVQAESLANAPSASKRKVVWEYDYRSRRIRQTTSDKSSGTYVVAEDLKFVADGWRHIAELNFTNNALVRSYAWGIDLSGSRHGSAGVGGLLMLYNASSHVDFYGYDGNGNVSTLVSAANGMVSAHFEYSTFGQTLRATGLNAGKNPFQFSTKRSDSTTGLLLYEYRTYASSVGRWASRDPISERGGNNIYAMLRNNSVDHHDPFGLYSSAHPFPDVSVPIDSIKCNKICGPDYTAAVNSVIKQLGDYLSLATLPMPSDGGISWPPTQEDADAHDNLIAFFQWFRQVALSLDYFNQIKDSQGLGLPNPGCPSIKCLNTITLCGKCVESDVPGNIMFGYMSAALGLKDSVRNALAAGAEGMDGDGERDGLMAFLFGDDDADVFPLGKELYEKESTDVCSVLKKLSGHANSACAPCGNAGYFAFPTKFNTVPYPVYR